MCIRDRHKDNPSSDKHAGQPAESDDAINTMSGALDPGPVVLTRPEPWVPHLAALTRTGQGVEPVPVPAARVLARLHQSNRRDAAQPLPRRGGLGQGHDPALHLRVADLLTGRIRVLTGAQRIVKHHSGAAKRPGQQRSLGWGRVRAVAVTSEHPLNVVSPTDIDRCCRCRRPTSSGYPGPEGPGSRRPNARSWQSWSSGSPWPWDSRPEHVSAGPSRHTRQLLPGPAGQWLSGAPGQYRDRRRLLVHRPEL